jgi:hypothetical protein
MRKKYATGIFFGSFLEAAALAGLTAHLFIVLGGGAFFRSLSVTIEHGGAGGKYGAGGNGVLLFCISAGL